MPPMQSRAYVIDDDESVRKAFERLLRSANLEVETFASVGEFFNGEPQGENACIVVDIRMPGSTGFDLQRELSSRGIGMPVKGMAADVERETCRERV